LEGLGHDVRNHELCRAVNQLDDFLDNKVVDPEVSDLDVSLEL
jgi:hypothetical protein